MVHVSTQVLLTVLAISPAFAAPLAQQFEEEQFARGAEPNFEARDSSDSLDAREPISPAVWEFGKKAFTAVAAGGGLGAIMAPLFRKKKDGNQKRSFEEDLDARYFEDDSLDAREPISPAVWEFGKKAFTAVAAGGGLGAIMGPLFRKKKDGNQKRYFEEDLDARDFADDSEYLVVRNTEDGTLDVYVRDPINPAALLKVGTTIGKAVGAVGRHIKWALPALAGGGFAAGAVAANKQRSFEDDLDVRDFVADDGEYLVVRNSEDGSFDVYARDPINPAGLLKIGTTIGKAVGSVGRHIKWALPALAGGGFAAGAVAANKARSFEDDLDAREFDELEYVSRYFDEDLMEAREFESLEELD